MATTNESWLCHESVEHEVGPDKILRFYALSYGALARLKAVGKPIFEALAALLSEDLRKKDRGTVYRSWTNDSEQSKGDEATTHPISLDLARLRSQEREMAVGKIVDAFTDEKNGREIARAVMDSLRDEFPKPITDAQVKAFYESVDLVTMNRMIVGLMKANGSAFGPFADLIRLKLKGVLEAAKAVEPKPTQATGTGG